MNTLWHSFYYKLNSSKSLFSILFEGLNTQIFYVLILVQMGLTMFNVYITLIAINLYNRKKKLQLETFNRFSMRNISISMKTYKHIRYPSFEVFCEIAVSTWALEQNKLYSANILLLLDLWNLVYNIRKVVTEKQNCIFFVSILFKGSIKYINILLN